MANNMTDESLPPPPLSSSSITGSADKHAMPYSYPLPAYLAFCPGGLGYPQDSLGDHFYNLAEYSKLPHSHLHSPRNAANVVRRAQQPPDVLVQESLQADQVLRQATLFYAAKHGMTTAPHYLPSLSCLAEAAFGRLTGVPSGSAKAWADAMVVGYLEEAASSPERVPQSEDAIFHTSRETSSQDPVKDTTANVLKTLLEEAQQRLPSDPQSATYRPRPCGYVFKRGDIAWNCRTCQTDSTCVICDDCFRQSDHTGHEVFFHRTTPGGCCDCGDAEAWKMEGCCDAHRPQITQSEAVSSADDPQEAVRMAQKGLEEGQETLTQGETALPPRFAAALGTVIGAAVHCLTQAVDGAGIGTDPSQWRLRWMEEVSNIFNGVTKEEHYHRLARPKTITPRAFLEENSSETMPDNYRLHLRLHNDDVHTFDEVIDALHESRHVWRNNSNPDDGQHQQQQPLVTMREAANDMTHHVDSDGQVTVKSYSSVAAAMQGFRRLKSRGLHCAVVSTAQMDLEQRARALSTWLSEIAAAHPAAAVLVVEALVQAGSQTHLAQVPVWRQARTMPAWAVADEVNLVEACKRRFRIFPPHLSSSYLTCGEAEKLFQVALELNPARFIEVAEIDANFYSRVAFRLPPFMYHKSPHALWGTLPSLFMDIRPVEGLHPMLSHLKTGSVNYDVRNELTEHVYVVDTDMRKQQEAERLTSSVYPHKLPGLHLVSGVGQVRLENIASARVPPPKSMEYRHLLATSSFRAPLSPILLLLLLDPYPTKQLRGAVHSLFLSLLTDARFKCRFAAALGVSYRPLSTLFCAGVGTEADTPLGFTVQIFTAGSLVRALGSAPAIEKLLLPDNDADFDMGGPSAYSSSIGVFTMPIAHVVVRSIHTNLLGSTKEVHMIMNNTAAGNDDDSHEEPPQNDSLMAALTYIVGEHPLMTILPAAPDDGFLDARSTRHKRLPHLLRDLEYVIETPNTAMRLLLPEKYPSYQGVSLSSRGEEILSFAKVWARLLRLAQGMDPQKRKISGGHVEYEQNRWLEAFGLSLNFAGTRDALAESPTNSGTATLAPVNDNGSHLVAIREAVGNILAALLRELKFWLYREGMLETGLPVPPGGGHGGIDLSQVEALQRSTLHVSSSQLPQPEASGSSATSVSTIALSCATSVKMTEAQLDLIEGALRVDGAERSFRSTTSSMSTEQPDSMRSPSGSMMGDWLRVPHSPMAGDSMSFHLPLHRALSKSVRSYCSVVVPESVRVSNPAGWWKLPVLDDHASTVEGESGISSQHPLVPLIKPALRSSNCRVVWSSGPECSNQEAHKRRQRSRSVSANIAVAKIIHSLADHPIRCLAAAQQIERHLWARNGGSTAGMALNYSSTPLCRSFRDLDLSLVQLSASGMSPGLGARRVFNLLISRFSMDGYLCDPERRSHGGASGNAAYGTGLGSWVNPPRLQDPDHAVVLAESFFITVCVLVTELPPPPPTSHSDDTSLRDSIKRELVHALAAEPRSHSAAMGAASCAINRRDESDGNAGTSGGGGLFRDVFTSVLREVGKQKGQSSSRSGSSPPQFELKAEYCDEYDPTFFHLRRHEHQHAMDVIASLRKQKLAKDDSASSESYSFPVVCPPPKAHPRFLPCRLMLHLPIMDASVRRWLLYALTSGSWLPPSEPPQRSDADQDDIAQTTSNVSIATSVSGDVSTTTFSRRNPIGGPFHSRHGSFSDHDKSPPFSEEIAASSSVSFLEVLQLLTLQVHTLEECAALHRDLPDLDDEAKSISSGLSINSYLGRLVKVPESLVDVWALLPPPNGPLRSNGSGANRGSILGLLIALYEHRADHGAGVDAAGGQDQGGDGHGGARALAANGLKWLLRFVNALVDGAPSVAAALRSATTGVPIKGSAKSEQSLADKGSTIWSINSEVSSTIISMLANLPDLWPTPPEASAEKTVSSDVKNKERGKAAQKRMLEMMRKKQSAFAAMMGPSDSSKGSAENETSEEDLCIICRCDDTDGENNGPMGFLGHVQRSRVCQMRACREGLSKADEGFKGSDLFNTFRVVGHMGCQLRESEAMDSPPLTCLPRGSIVSVLKSAVAPEYDVLSRRVLVRHISHETGAQTEGWASVQSSQGYVILTPVVSLCYENSRWGNTRPIVKTCGHAAHLRCVETHTLSLHQRAAGEQPYDGRFAANIDDGEFLCPLCKQLSNILIPRDRCVRRIVDGLSAENSKSGSQGQASGLRSIVTSGTKITASKLDNMSDMGRKALADFGAHLMQAMDVPWERTTGARKRKHRQWHPAIQRWDYEEEDEDMTGADTSSSVRSVLRMFRQQHIAWASVGHSAATAEAAARGVEDVLPFGVFSKTEEPWPGFLKEKDGDSSASELIRIMCGSSGLQELFVLEMTKQLRSSSSDGGISIIGKCLYDLLEGNSWMADLGSFQGSGDSLLWSQLTTLMAALPCHVARDGMISQSHEARAAAVQMWTVKALGNASRPSKDNPPTPFAIAQRRSSKRNRESDLRPNWGTMNPLVTEGDVTGPPILFRPAVATAFLFTPILAWDLNTFAGAMFSTTLLNETVNMPTSAEILQMVHYLLLARVVQAIITPLGYDLGLDEMDTEGDEEGRWDPSELQRHSLSLSKLVLRAKAVLESRPMMTTVSKSEGGPETPSLALFADVGRAILPFARSMVLMVRAFVCISKQRSKRAGLDTSDLDDNPTLKAFIEGSDLMTSNDGFFLLRTAGCPLPGDVVDDSSSWWTLINRWLVAVAGFEKHHGTNGKSALDEILSPDSKGFLESSTEAKKPKTERSGTVGSGVSSAMDTSEANAAMEAVDTSDEDMDFGDDNDEARPRPRSFGQQSEFDGSDGMDMEDDGPEMMGLDDPVIGLTVGNQRRSPSRASENDDATDDPSTSGSDGEGEGNDLSYVFANVGDCPIVSHQPSFLGMEPVGPGKRGSSIEDIPAGLIISDMSHLGQIHLRNTPSFSLVRLPKSFVELYGVVSKGKGRDETATLDEADDVGSSETAICLLTGAVMRSGSLNRSRSYSRSQRPPGACTLHARKNGSGIGIFFLVQKCTVLLMHNNKSAYSPSIYVDEHGEEDPGLRRGRPLFLNESRYRALEQLWRQQGIPREVAQIRSTSDRVIRDNWY